MHTACGITVPQPSMLSMFTGGSRNGLTQNGYLLFLLTSFPFFFFPESKSSLIQDRKQTMKEVLSRRKNELFTLKEEKTNVDSLLKLCGRVKDVIKGDILKALK